MNIGQIITTLISVVMTILTAGIAWGKLYNGQVQLSRKIVDLQQQMDLRMKEIMDELHEIPKLYVRIDVDQQREKLMDAREATLQKILQEIKDELRALRQRATN